MAARTFTIFQDADAAPTVTTKPTSFTLSTTVTMSNVPINLPTPTDKENLHPLTGERAGPSTATSGKKRKNSITSMKALAPIEPKRTKEADAEPELKKRKPLSSDGATRKLKSTKKEGKGPVARKASKRSSRAPSPMPKVEEETADTDKDVHNLTQREIDAKCYDLTVKPLADLSQAYSQASPLEWLEEENVEETDADKLQFVKEVSLEPELRDIFTPASLGLANQSSSDAGSQESKALSTPERKHLYHSFTFSSPSPVRISRMTRSTSVPRLDISRPKVGPSSS